MRTLKFRAWDSDAKEMRGHGNLMIDMSGLQYWQFGYDAPTPIELDREPFIMMQWTGLCDKNGAEIYEGDVIKWKSTHQGASQLYHTDKMTWDDEGACYMLLPWIHEPYAAEMEVIGNIYENPELIAPTE